jgi:hypothetical protein
VGGERTDPVSVAKICLAAGWQTHRTAMFQRVPGELPLALPCLGAVNHPRVPEKFMLETEPCKISRRGVGRDTRTCL